MVFHNLHNLAVSSSEAVRSRMSKEELEAAAADSVISLAMMGGCGLEGTGN